MGFIAFLNTEILGKPPKQIRNFPASNKGKVSRRREKCNEVKATKVFRKNCLWWFMFTVTG